MLIKDVVCLVTGGASGLGLATARRLVENGAKVVIADLQEDNGRKIAEHLGKDCTFVQADVSSEKDVNFAITKAIENYGLINASVNCAGVMFYSPCVKEDGECHTLELFEKTMKINGCGTFNVARLVAKAMTKNEPNKEGERGVIINVSSIHGFEGVAGRVAYAASKGAVHGMTLPLARDLAKFGIRVMCIAPGLFDTPMTIGAIPDPVARAELGKTIPFPNRAGTTDEFSHLVQTVIENPMLNGEIIRIDAAYRLPR